jgi:hypothetical protein
MIHWCGGRFASMMGGSHHRSLAMPFPFRHLMWVHMRSIPVTGQGKPATPTTPTNRNTNPNTKEH